MPALLSCCEFETRRLIVKEWHSLSSNEWHEEELAEVVARMLTESVTRSLPPAWQGGYSLARARAWVEERDAEGTTLLAIDLETRRPAGLVILHLAATETVGAGADVRLGYLLAEESWGRGLASELVAGLVTWCRGQSALSSITGGVAPDNPASARVLEKVGFEPLASEGEATGEQLYRLTL